LEQGGGSGGHGRRGQHWRQLQPAWVGSGGGWCGFVKGSDCGRHGADGGGCGRRLPALPIPGHGSLEMVGLRAFCARATGAATSWLLLPFFFSTATLVWRRHGGRAGGGKCLLVVPRWYFGRGRASSSRDVADAAGSGLLAWPRACGRHGVEPGESLHWHFVSGDGGGALGASLFLLGHHCESPCPRSTGVSG
jgi:hypothetical protein